MYYTTRAAFGRRDNFYNEDLPMYRALLFSSIFLLLSPLNLFADSLDIGFNDFSAQVGTRMRISQDTQGFSETNARGLYNKNEDTLLGSLGLDIYGSLENMLAGVHFGAGAKLYGGETDDEEMLSLALGGLLRMAPTAWQGVGFSASYFYGPQIFSTLDVQRLTEFQASIDYEFIPRSKVFVGYGNLQTNFKEFDKRTIDEGFRLGITLSY